MNPKTKDQLDEEYKDLVYGHKFGKEKRPVKFRPARIRHHQTFSERNPDYEFEDEGVLLQQKFIYAVIKIIDNEEYLQVRFLGEFDYYIPLWQIENRKNKKSGQIINILRHHNGRQHPKALSYKQFNEQLLPLDNYIYDNDT